MQWLHITLTAKTYFGLNSGLFRYLIECQSLHPLTRDPTFARLYSVLINLIKHLTNRTAETAKLCEMNKGSKVFRYYFERVIGAVELLEGLGFRSVLKDGKEVMVCERALKAAEGRESVELIKLYEYVIELN